MKRGLVGWEKGEFILVRRRSRSCNKHGVEESLGLIHDAKQLHGVGPQHEIEAATLIKHMVGS